MALRSRRRTERYGVLSGVSPSQRAVQHLDIIRIRLDLLLVCMQQMRMTPVVMRKRRRGGRREVVYLVLRCRRNLRILGLRQGYWTDEEVANDHGQRGTDGQDQKKLGRVAGEDYMCDAGE